MFYSRMAMIYYNQNCFLLTWSLALIGIRWDMIQWTTTWISREIHENSVDANKQPGMPTATTHMHFFCKYPQIINFTRIFRCKPTILGVTPHLIIYGNTLHRFQRWQIAICTPCIFNIYPNYPWQWPPNPSKIIQSPHEPWTPPYPSG